jgi:uncharacterized protein DUF4019
MEEEGRGHLFRVSRVIKRQKGPAMGTRREFVAWLSALSLAGLSRPLGADQGAEEQAADAAREWLRLVDGGCCASSWEEAAPMFRIAVAPEQWDEAVHSVRTPLGRCVSRALRSRRLVDGFSGGPRGPYVVLKFDAEFEHGAHAVETVTPVRGPDDRWRVASYFIDEPTTAGASSSSRRKVLRFAGGYSSSPELLTKAR